MKTAAVISIVLHAGLLAGATAVYCGFQAVTTASVSNEIPVAFHEPAPAVTFSKKPDVTGWSSTSPSADPLPPASECSADLAPVAYNPFSIFDDPTPTRRGVTGVGGGFPDRPPRGSPLVETPVVQVGGPAIGDGGAVAIFNPQPEYPARARRKSIEGEVRVEIAIAADGAVETITVIESSGSEDLDAAAVDAARSWKYKPAFRSGAAVASVERVRFVFKLE